MAFLVDTQELKPGLVIFCAAENPEDVWTGRLTAIQKTYGSLDSKFVPISRALPLDDDETLERYLDMFKRIAREQPIRLIVNDTLKRSIGEQDANGNAELLFNV